MLVVATRNPGKLAEFRRLLGGSAWRVVDLTSIGYAGELPEPGTTYAENAAAKALAVAAVVDLPVLADDSGIEVDALGGWPGPHSARWMGEAASDHDRLHGLLAEVARRSPGDPRARYVCVVALARPAADVVCARGETLGRLVPPRGEAGFGYDPAFLSRDLGITFGEATDEAKDRVSHRARALIRLAESQLLAPR
jgi:non-canonical purine NTP pyrophosphatase (RdgB/HAM1 family)